MNLAELSIRRPIFITCVFFLILAVGLISLLRIPVDLFPDVSFPVVTVTTPYPGAGPLEVETLVSKVVEDEVSTISGVKNVRSVNKEGVSTVIVEFELSTDVKYAEQQVRDRVSAARRKLPNEIEESTIRRIDPSDQPVITISLTADTTPSELYDLANEIIRPKIQQVNQVGLVEVLGGRKREIQVQLDQDKLRLFQISASTVAQRIGAAGENVPAGKVSVDESELVYRTLAEFNSPKEIESTIVSFYANERQVRVNDLGRVVDTLEDEKSRVFLNGTRSLVLQVFRQSGSNTVAVVNDVKKRLAKINEEYKDHPKKVRLSVVRDNSVIIHNNVFDVQEAIIIGIILTVLVVLYFLGSVRSTFITGLALPNSLLGAFILMAWAGFSVNIMTLLALSLAVGLLIDDAIVVRENIFRHLEMGKTPRQAAIEGTNEVLLAVIATTMTVIAVFGPIGFLQGVVGQFFKQFGLTVCFAMMISLFDALTMAPMLSSYFAGRIKHGHSGEEKEGEKRGFVSRLWNRTVQPSIEAFDRLQRRLENVYESTLNLVMAHPKKVILMGLSIFVVSVLGLRFVPKTFLPAQDNGEFTVRLEMPPGTSIDGMSQTAAKVDQAIRANKEVKNSLLLVGGRDGEANVATLFIQLVGSKQRKMNTSEMKDLVRQQLKDFAHAAPIVSDVDATGSGQRPFTVNFAGSDLGALEVYVHKLFDKIKDHPGLKDPEIASKPGKPEFQFVMDPERAESLGVSSKVAGAELRVLVEGTVPAVLRSSGLEYDVRVRSMEEQRKLKDRVNKIYVPNINGKLVQLASISTPVEKTGPAVINRENRNRYVSISADIAPNGPGMGGAIAEIRRITSQELPPPQGITYSFVGQAENFQELIVNMLVAMVLGILFIYFVLASLYESFVTPFVIMLVLPLALCGAFFALLFSGKSLDLFSMIGCVMLLGVATKNSILLVDYTNQLLQQGMERNKAIILAGKVRLRPILMTSFALIAGMLPVAIGLNEASKQRTSMGIAIIGGLISSTLLTLVIVPAAFPYVDDFGNWLKRKFQKVSGASEEEETPHEA